MRRLPALALGLALSGAAPGAHAHDASHSGTAPPPLPAVAAAPFPIEIRPRFALIDQGGVPVTEADFRGLPVLVFFGYAACQGICPVALPLIEEALERLGAGGGEVAALVVTVDPERDTPGAMRRALAKFPLLTGLTGSEAALASARAAFQVEAAHIAEGPDGPIYAHGGLIYLLDRTGRVAAMLPPTLSAGALAATVARHVPGLMPG